MQGAEELRFDEIDSTGLVEPARDFYPAALQVKLSLVAAGQNHVIVSRLQLHPIPCRLPTVITLAIGRERWLRPGPQTVLQLSEPAEIIAGRRKLGLAQELPDREDLCSELGV